VKRHLDLSRGTLGNIWTVSWPVMASLVLFVAQLNVDMFWIGMLGAHQVAAVALCGAVWFVVMALVQVVGGGAGPLVGRHAGAGREADLRRVVESALALCLAAAVVVGAVGAGASDAMVGFFRAEPQVHRHAVTYLQALFIGAPVVYGGRVVFDVMGALGDTRTLLKISAAATLVNLALDPLLIFGWWGFPRLGVLGAAVATVGSYAVSCGLGLWVLRRQLSWSFPPRTAAHVAEARRILAIGLPACLQAISRPITGMLMFGIAAHFGTAVIAGFGIGLRCLSLMFVYLESLGVATRTLVAQHLGAGDSQRAREVVGKILLLGLLLQGGVTLAFELLAPYMVAAFNAQPDVVAAGVGYLRIVSAAMPLLVVAIACGGAQSGAGHTRPPMIASLVGNWVVKLPLAYLAAHHLSSDILAALGGDHAGIWLAIAASVAAEAALVALFYKRGRWLEECNP